jgi:propanediol dehydratase large subunit
MTIRTLIAAVMTLACAGRASADNYAVVVSGASGGPAYAEKYNAWRTTLTTTLKSRFGYPDERVVSIGDASKDQLQQVFAKLRMQLTKDDMLAVMLMGHGTGEKFNLVGPDISAAEWAAQLKPIPARIASPGEDTEIARPSMRSVPSSGRRPASI